MKSASAMRPPTKGDCPKCSSRMHKLSKRMALVSVRNVRTPIAPVYEAAGAGLVVRPRVCSSCGLVELYAADHPVARSTDALPGSRMWGGGGRGGPKRPSVN